MRGADSVETRGAQVAAFTSMLLIAQQVSGKAVRDALFLSSFHATSLPLAMAMGALLSLAGVYGLSQWMARSTPAAIMPALFSISAAAFGFAWLLAQSAPRPAAALIYLQTALLGPLMISTFWSLINERFDPHTAKRAVARISGGGTLGGVLGGLVVWRASKVVEPASVILLLAALNALAVVGTLLTRARRAPSAGPAVGDAREAPPSPARVLLRAAFLRNLAILVALSAAISAMLDYLLSAEAVATIGKGQALLSFFSLFWLGVAICSFVVQMLLGKVAIEKLSLAINIAFLPGTILLGGALGLAVPGLVSSVLLRGAEAVQRNTLFRSAYELLYTPVPEASKRVTKAVIDVGFDRVGTIVGSGIALTILSSAVRAPHSVLLTSVIPLALASLPLARRLHTGYVGALQEGLRLAAASVDSSDEDGSRRSLGADTRRPLQLARDRLIERLEDIQPGGLSALVDDEVAREHENSALAPAQAALDAPATVLGRVRRLLSGSDTEVQRALGELDGRGPDVACAIMLLAHRAHHERALAALRRVAVACTGQLLDALLDPSMDFRVRRRLPRALEDCRTQRAADGLLLGLSDDRFEVRYACARALVKITDGDTPIRIPEDKVLAAIEHEVESGKRIVERSAGDDDGDASSLEPFVAGLVEDRVDRSLEHVFRVLSLVFEREPLRLAFRALHHEDSKYRGTALEYLDSVLPAPVRELIGPYLGAAGPLPVARPTHELLADLAEAK